MPLPSRPTSTPPAASPGTSGSRHSSSALDSDFGFRISNFRHAPRRGFTLTEILVVIVIIVLIIGMAVPALRFITGSRSQAGAANMISAMLARARNDAIGLQVPTGVCFYQDATTGRTMMAEVQTVTFTQWNTTTAPTSPTLPHNIGEYATDGTNYCVCTYNCTPGFGNVPNGSTAQPSSIALTNTSYWTALNDPKLLVPTSVSYALGFPYSNAQPYLVDQVVGTDAEALPSGVGAAILNDAGQTGGASNAQDRYLRTGALMFDANGRLIVQPVWISHTGIVGSAAGYATKAYDIAQNNAPAAADVNQGAKNLLSTSATPATPASLVSSVGVVTYDGQAFSSQYGSTPDYVIDGGTYSAAKDNWLDTNATPLLVNRYNGTLMNNQ